MAAITQRVAEVTIESWAQEVSDLMGQKYAFLHCLKEKGGIKFGKNGTEMKWPFRFKDHTITGYQDLAPRSYERTRLHDNASLGWRGYESNEAISHMEKLQNGGKGHAVIIDIFKNRADMVRDGLMRELGTRFHKSGSTAQGIAENRFHGIESFGDVTGGSQTASDVLATVLASSYGGHSTAYGSLDASTVLGDPGYKAWSPVVVNCNVNPGSGVRAWADYADEYIRTAIIEASFGAGSEDQLDTFFLNKNAYKALLNILDGKERINFKRGEDVGLVKAGFKQAVELDGTEILWDFGVPAADESSTDVVHGYGYNFDKMELQMLNRKSLWDVRFQWSSAQDADVFLFSCLGNLKFESPKFQALLKELS